MKRKVVVLALGVSVVAIGAIVYVAFTTTIIGCLGPCGQYFPSVTITGTIVLSPGSNNGTLTVQVNNSGVNNTAILGLTVTNLGPNYHGQYPNNNVSSVAMMYHGNLVNSVNALPKGGTATASVAVTKVERGATYSVEIEYVYANGSAGSESYNFQAPS